MADIDEVAVTVNEKQLVATIFWTQLWPRIKDRSWKWRFRVFGIELRPSVKVSGLKDEFEKIFGPSFFA